MKIYLKLSTVCRALLFTQMSPAVMRNDIKIPDEENRRSLSVGTKGTTFSNKFDYINTIINEVIGSRHSVPK